MTKHTVSKAVYTGEWLSKIICICLASHPHCLFLIRMPVISTFEQEILSYWLVPSFNDRLPKFTLPDSLKFVFILFYLFIFLFVCFLTNLSPVPANLCELSVFIFYLVYLPSRRGLLRAICYVLSGWRVPICPFTESSRDFTGSDLESPFLHFCSRTIHNRAA